MFSSKVVTAARLGVPAWEMRHARMFRNGPAIDPILSIGTSRPDTTYPNIGLEEPVYCWRRRAQAVRRTVEGVYFVREAFESKDFVDDDRGMMVCLMLML